MNYAVLHSTRSVWSSATKGFTTLYPISADQIANMNSCFLVSYGVCGFFTG